MPEGYSYEIRVDAKDLYVVEGMTYEQVAEATGVSVSQLKRWGGEESWTEARKEYRDALSSIRMDKIRLRAGLLKTALETQDPQAVYAYAAMERAANAGKKTADEPAPAILPDRLKNIKTPADAVAALQEVVVIKLARLLSQPEAMDFAKTKDIKQTLELVEQMQAKYAPQGENKDKGLDADGIKSIREMLSL